MKQSSAFHPASPILNFCPPSLPAHWYFDPTHYARELSAIHRTSWMYVGRADELPSFTMRRVDVAGQNLFIIKDGEDVIRCFHNTCRHRGSELCQHQDTKLKSKLITCPYHDWGYDLSGQLVQTPHVTETPGFDQRDHGLFSVHVKTWNGFIFICLAKDAPDFSTISDLGPKALDNWPMGQLVTGHRLVKKINCNWKVFWENYNECLHCPGIHHSLCDTVPIYRQGVMSASEAPGWTPDEPLAAVLKDGAQSWTNNGRACGPEFPDLTEDQRRAAFLFVTLMPTMYVVGHVDYVRVVSLRPLGPEETELSAEWLFSSETLAQPDFDLSNVVDFATTVMLEDGAACELNQRGFHSSRFAQGTLMPQEFDVFHFQQWVRRKLGEPVYVAGSE